MWIKTLEVTNIRCFAQAKIEFSAGINLLVGPNNAGKSTILLPILALQSGQPQLQESDARLQTDGASAQITFSDNSKGYFDGASGLTFEQHPQNRQFYRKHDPEQPHRSLDLILGSEPNNLIYTFTSKRKVTTLEDDVRSETVVAVPQNFSNLNAKIDRLSNPEFLPAHSLYMRACDEILGFRVTTAHTGRGKRAVYTVRNMINIPLTSMGEGVMNILGLVVHLALAEKKVLILEEPENDIHPRALKALLDLVIEKSADNQFVITTHSNIVLKALGASNNARIFRIQCSLVERMPTSTVTDVGDSPDARRAILEELGYELHDADLWDAWLILEESSAEKIIREYLIPWFCPNLRGRLRTMSAHSLSEVLPRFRDFDNLFVYLHLTPTYKNRAWVLLDGGGTEAEIAAQLRSRYCPGGWREDRFLQLKNHDFERYYPSRFAEKVECVLSIEDKGSRREQKRSLLAQVEEWIASEPELAKQEFAESASEIIEVLSAIQQAIRPT
jgi:predicted ATPase